MAKLGVNIDHVATVREARKTYEPSPVEAAKAAERGGADGITIHLREDRRHIQDHDLAALKEIVSVKLNLELACVNTIVTIACHTQPEQATLVPERREEITTEGGLDVVRHTEEARCAIERLKDAGIWVSLFLDPDASQIDMATKLGADAVELHTGQYALAKGAAQEAERNRLRTAGEQIVAAGLQLNAGHGLNYQNVQAVASLDQMHELNIGHSIVSRALFVGMENAVREMKGLI